MYFSRISFLTFLLHFSLLAFGQNDWTMYKADAVLSFEVEVPGEVNMKIKDFETAVGNLTSFTYAHEGGDEDQNYLYLINIVEYPMGTFDLDSLDFINEYIENTISTKAENLGGEIVYSSDLEKSSNGYGKVYRIKYNKGSAVVKGKSFIRKDVFVNLQVFTLQEKSLNDDMDRFLNSFKATF